VIGVFLLFFAVGILTYQNARLAARKGRNAYIWGFFSLIAFIVGFILLGDIYLAAGYRGPQNKEAVSKYIMNALSEPLNMMMMLMLGIGGMLIVRFFLERGKSPGGPGNQNNGNGM
jgi:hypothetical protein